MIQLKTILTVVDNSGAKTVECIRVLRNKQYASLGDVITVAVKTARAAQIVPTRGGGVTAQAPKVKKGEVRRAVVVRVRAPVRRPDGTLVRFDDNACAIIDNNKQPIGSRVLGLVAADELKRDFARILSLAPRTI